MVLSLHQNVYLPKMEYTTDNAMMIARLAYEKWENNMWKFIKSSTSQENWLDVSNHEIVFGVVQMLENLL